MQRDRFVSLARLRLVRLLESLVNISALSRRRSCLPEDVATAADDEPHSLLPSLHLFARLSLQACQTLSESLLHRLSPHSTMTATPSAAAFTSHLISRLESDLVFLHSQQLLSEADLGLIRSKLTDAQRQAELQAGVGGLAVSAPAPRTVPPPPARADGGKKQCRALWDYSKSQVRSRLAFRTSCGDDTNCCAPSGSRADP